ncbi:MAG: phosphatase PAP2 family protein [Armatimonadota bacterium]
MFAYSSRRSELRPYALGVAAFALLVLAVSLCPHPAAGVVRAVRFVSGTGNAWFLIVGYLALFAAAWRARDWREARRVFLVLLAVTVTVQLLKAISGPLLRPNGRSAGYPSGHSAAAFALAFLLAKRFPRVGAAAFTCATAIAWSRVMTAAHFPYQVYVGTSLGLLVAHLVAVRASIRALYVFARRYHVLLSASVPIASLLYTINESESHAVTVLGFALFLAGLALRVWARQHSARPFPTSGPYALLRHPSFLANTLLAVGVTATCEILWLIPVTAALCAAVYTLAARADEERMLALHGEAYARYMAAVPRWLPRRLASGPRAPLLPALVAELPMLLLLLPVLGKEIVFRD